MRLFAFFAAVLVFCLWFTAPSRGQTICGPNGCYPAQQGFQSYYSQPSYSTQASDGATYQRQWVRGPLGFWRIENVAVEAAPQVSAQAKLATAASGCLCGPGCPCPVAANPLEASVKPNTPKLREVTIPAGMGLYQNAAGDLFLLNREAVTASMDVIPASGWKWQAAK